MQDSPNESNLVVFTSTTAANIFGKNVMRNGGTIYNEGAGTLFVLLGSSVTGVVSATVYTIQIASGGYYEIPGNFAGVIQGKFSASGTARCTELVRI